MIYINKGSEPMMLRAHKSKPHSNYNNLDKDTLDSIRDSLLNEQGYICAYCMKRIEKSNMKIEHYISQSFCNEKALDYSNMLGVCSGNMGSGGKNKTCDTHRSIRNQTLTVSPLDQTSIAAITYSSNGEITSDDANIKYDISETLNLNHIYLKEGRKAVLNKSKQMLIDRMPKNGPWSKDKLLKIRNDFLSLDKGELEEYVGVIIYCLDKKLK